MPLEKAYKIGTVLLKFLVGKWYNWGKGRGGKVKFTVITLILILIIGLSFQSPAFAQGKVRIEDMIIGSIFKNLAKAFIAATDINKLKKDNIDKLNKMDANKFRRRYAKVFEVIKDLPPDFKISYGVSEQMAKEQLIKDIESFDRRRMNEAIDSIPETIIVKQFKKYLSEKKQEIQKGKLTEQINKFWNKVVDKINGQS